MVRLIVIVGPTAGGKSELAAGLATTLPGGGEVLGADSMQVYRHMDAGTAKPEPALRERAPHHFIDIVEPTEKYSVADWLAAAEPLIGRLVDGGRWPIVVGGTNLYLKSLLEGMFEGPGQDDALRTALAQRSAGDLHRELAAVDPPAAARIHPNDHKRLVRALEVLKLTGKPISAWQQQWDRGADAQGDRYRHDPVMIGIDWPAEAINRRINLRVKAMFYPEKAKVQDGVTVWPGTSLIEETHNLESRGLLGAQAREALGYKQVLAHLRGELSEAEAFEQTKIQTRRFARQQRTWLRRYRGVHWLQGPQREPEELLAEAADAIGAAGER